MTVLHERALTPAAPLQPWVSEVRVLTLSPSPARAMTRLPSGTSSLVLCTAHTEGLEVVATGPNTRASYKLARAVPLYVRFAFRPGGARAFFGVALHELADRIVSINDLWGPRAQGLRGRLAQAEGEVERTIRTLEEALLEQFEARRGSSWHSELVRRAASALEAGDAEPEHIHSLAQRLGVSERLLRQVFREEVGISPKRYARIARIRRVVARAGSAGWAQLAVESGFYDQAHLTAEFRDLLGVTPRSFLAGDVPVQKEC
ncbi:AraC family transcriptional regulator [Hyalangium versicolor]|uniref:AraC family transcriptional regulator n=1 Tax=Hyalangium versicolor TaxID=2861190 RepID=UPI002815853C|nr:AraC family transcriptional regulator [Hyalangium versicolor]